MDSMVSPSTPAAPRLRRTNSYALRTTMSEQTWGYKTPNVRCGCALAARKSFLWRSLTFNSACIELNVAVTQPFPPRKHNSSRGPSLQRHYPPSSLLWPPPTSRKTSGHGFRRIASYAVPYDGRASHRSPEISIVPSFHLLCVLSLSTSRTARAVLLDTRLRCCLRPREEGSAIPMSGLPSA